MPTDRTYSTAQLAFAAVVIVVFALLTWGGEVNGDATVALASGVTGAVLGAPLAARAGQSEARANGMREGADIANRAQNGADA